jgi:Uma2 family endonuclease
LREEADHILEYIDGVVYMAPSPSINHQRISSFLHGELYNALKGKNCEVFAAPADVLFDAANNDEKKTVVPDLFVTCSPENLTENEHVGASDFIIEILSPSNISHDIVTKLNL